MTTASRADQEVPFCQGLYASFVRDIECLPKSMKGYQLSGESLPQLIYIGKSTGQGGLHQRIAFQDL